MIVDSIKLFPCEQMASQHSTTTSSNADSNDGVASAGSTHNGNFTNATVATNVTDARNSTNASTYWNSSSTPGNETVATGVSSMKNDASPNHFDIVNFTLKVELWDSENETVSQWVSNALDIVGEEPKELVVPFRPECKNSSCARRCENDIVFLGTPTITHHHGGMHEVTPLLWNASKS